MSDVAPHSISELLIICDNDKCAECSSLNVEYVSLFYNVFLCRLCKEVHQRFYATNLNLKSLLRELSDKFTRMELVILNQSGGNAANRATYEKMLPAYYSRPTPRSVPLVRREFILAKYERLEFMEKCSITPSDTTSSSLPEGAPETHQLSLGTDSITYKKGMLLKRLKTEDNYMERVFELNMQENFLRYFKPDSRKPKKSLNLERLNATILEAELFQVPENSMLVSELTGQGTRFIFLSAKDSATLMGWYIAIRGAKYHRALLYYSGLDAGHVDQHSIREQLTFDYTMCGWLQKTGPQQKDALRRRWCMLGRRRLSYSIHRHSPYPQGEILIGEASDGFEVKMGAPANWKKHDGFTFTLVTPSRTFLFQEADSREMRDRWVEAIQRVIQTPMTLEDRKEAVVTYNKKSSASKSP